jgi:hypothetical protein
MAKTHYGYRDGQFKQGKCEVTTGTCPYGNHSEDPNKINDLREYVAKTLNENPNYQVAYEMVARMHGEKNVTAALLTQQGVPTKLAKAWANEPVSAEYERDYVADGASEVAAEPEPVTAEEPLVEVNPAEDNLWGTAAADKYGHIPYSAIEELEVIEDPAVYKESVTYYESDEERYRRRTGNRAIEEFQDLARRVRNPEFFGVADHDRVEEVFDEPYKTLLFIDQELQTDWARRHPGQPLPEELQNLDEMGALVNFNLPGNEVATNIVATDVREGALGITPEAREFAREHVSVANLLSHKSTGLKGYADGFVNMRQENLEATGKNLDLEKKKLLIGRHLERAAKDYQDAVDAKEARNEDLSGVTVDKIKADAEEFVKYGIVDDANSLKKARRGGSIDRGSVVAMKYYENVANHWRKNLKPGAYVMLGGSDAEVYTLQEDGGITSPDGKLSGYVDYESGVFYSVYGAPVQHGNGAPRLFENDEALLENAVAGGHYIVYPAPLGADPGHLSRYELSDIPRVQNKLAKIRNFVAEKDADYREIAQRNESIYKAKNDKQDTRAQYEALKKHGFKPLAHMEKGGKLTKTSEDRAKMEMNHFIEQEISAGRMIYADGAYHKNDGASIEELQSRKLDYDTVFDKDDDVATRVSMVNAVRRTHNTETSYRNPTSWARSKPLTRHEPVAHRRRDWGETPANIPPRDAVEGNLIVGDKVKRDGMPVTYLVVDDAERLMVEVPRTIHKSATVSGELDAPASNEELESLKARYRAGDKALTVMSIEDENEHAGKLRVW